MSKLPFLFFFLFFPLFFLFLSYFLFFSSPPYPFRFSSGPPLELPLLLSFSPPAAPGPLAAGRLGPRRRELGPPVAGRLRPPSHRELAPPPTASGTPADARYFRRWPPQASPPPRAHSAAGRLRAPCRHDLLPPPLAASGVLAAASSLRRRPPSPRWAA